MVVLVQKMLFREQAHFMLVVEVPERSQAQQPVELVEQAVVEMEDLHQH
jgi:hypothetical protein